MFAVARPFICALRAFAMTKDLILNLLQSGEQSLTRTFNAVPDDKLYWKPLDLGRPALDAFGEVAQTCQMIATLIESRGETKPSRETFAKMADERADWNRADALDAMQASTAALYAALDGLSEAELATPVTMPMGGGLTMPMSAWIMMAYRSMISRFAQINYIQTLYGDTESH